MNRRISNTQYRVSKGKEWSVGVHDSLFNIRHSSNPRAGSALILVLALIVMLSFLILGFGRMLRSDLQAASAFYDEAINTQMARSAVTLAVREMGRGNGMPYADDTGNLYFVSEPESYESEIEVLEELRDGFSLGRGMISYRFIQKPFGLDPNNLTLNEWDRLLEVACEIDSEAERGELTDCLMDWIDTDSNSRESGFEEEDYQRLDPPRHCRNDAVENMEELLLVYGMTEELFYGYGLPVHEEDGVLYGGGLYRYLIGDNSDEAEATVNYVLSGTLPVEDYVDDDKYDSDEYSRVNELPSKIYLIAQGFALGTADDASENLSSQDEINSASETFDSRHVMLIVFRLPEDGQSVDDYIMEDFQENAVGGLLSAVLAYGVEEQ
jgi:catechol 2,3-dioxygenase-like lactoylglutathione lyase family enzyme